jgi:hypothetical protein
VTRKQKQARMRAIVKRMIHYVDTYPQQDSYADYSDRLFIDDMLYGIGIAMHPKEFHGPDGFDKFLDVLQDRIEFNRPAVNQNGDA